MQYLTNPQGERLGVFLTISEWEAFCERHDMRPNDIRYDEWEQLAVQKALGSLESGNIVPDAEVRTHFAELGANIG